MGHSMEIEVALQTGGLRFRSGLRFGLYLAKFLDFRFFLWIEGGRVVGPLAGAASYSEIIKDWWTRGNGRILRLTHFALRVAKLSIADNTAHRNCPSVTWCLGTENLPKRGFPVLQLVACFFRCGKKHKNGDWNNKKRKKIHIHTKLFAFYNDIIN